MDRVDRPLSPHATLYSWRITNTLSIIHRVTGVFLSLGAFVLVWWLMSLAGGPGAYESALQLIDTLFFKLLATAWVFSFFFHLANGVRHLFWDVGHGFEPAQIRASGWAVVVFAVLVAAAYSVAVLF